MSPVPWSDRGKGEKRCPLKSCGGTMKETRMTRRGKGVYTGWYCPKCGRRTVKDGQ